MKINSISNIYKSNFITQRSEKLINNFSINNGPMTDTVSFRAKSYNVDQILNPTNHCAYCGCKVYSEAQIESIAKGMLQGKAHRLQGDIKSVLEKLESATRSDELTFAKKIENADEIQFFQNFLQLATDKSFLKGEAVFKQVYLMDTDEALETLMKNMRPLTRTVDHVSPQNLEEDNMHSDINLVEACYCCNHDLKKGVSFAEFYTMFPSIKENMPADKFHYAHANLMASSSSSILDRLSATSLLGHVQRLFGQRNEIISRLGNIDFRLAEADSSISSSIQTCKDEIQQKEEKVNQLQSQLDSLSEDDEYNAIVKRLQLIQQKNQTETFISSLRERRKNVSDALNEIRNPSRKQKKQSKAELTKEKKEARIEEMKETIASLSEDISLQESKRDDIEYEIMELDSQFPTIEILQSKKNKVDYLANSHLSLQKETINCQQLEEKYIQLSDSLSSYEEEISQYPEQDFLVANYSPEEQAQFSRYNLLVEAIKHIQGHSNGGGVKALINIVAKKSIEDEIDELSKTRVIKDYNDSLKRKELQDKIDSIIAQQQSVKNQISASKKVIAKLTQETESSTYEQTQIESQSLAEDIRRLNEKQTYVKLPQMISTLKAEIILLKQTISDLTAKQAQIGEIKKPTA